MRKQPGRSRASTAWDSSSPNTDPHTASSCWFSSSLSWVQGPEGQLPWCWNGGCLRHFALGTCLVLQRLSVWDLRIWTKRNPQTTQRKMEVHLPCAGPALGSTLVSNLSSKTSSLCPSYTSPRRPHLPLHLVPSPHGSLTRPLGETTRELTARWGGGYCRKEQLSLFMTWKVKVAQSCLTLCNFLYYSPPESSVHRILQARILEWVAISFRGSSPTRDWTQFSCTAGSSLLSEPPGKPIYDLLRYKNDRKQPTEI